MTYQEELSLDTEGHADMHDLTRSVESIVADSGVRAGVVNVFNIGSTGAVGAWHDGNGHSHLQATLQGPSLTVPIRNGKMVRGTWQQIFHLDCDVKPRRRSVLVTVVGD